MKRYKINYLSLTAAILLFIFALVFAKIIPGGKILQDIIIAVMFAVVLITRFYSKKTK